MKLSHLSETLIGSEIVKLSGEIKEATVKQVYLSIKEFKPLPGYQFFILVNLKLYFKFTR